MIIKKITLNNFRQYKGNCSVEFSTDKEKNVTVILGVNTSGKTTLIQAFNWCLYGECIFKEKEMMNLEVLNELSAGDYAELSVEIELIHEKREYIINRSERVTMTNSGYEKYGVSDIKVEYKEETGEMQEIPYHQIKDTINTILPEGLSDYFFFDGEHIADINNKKDVAAAIKGLMGIDVIDKAVEHLNPKTSSSVISKLRRELDIGQDDRSRSLKDKLKTKKERLEAINAEIDKCSEEIDFFSEKKASYDDMLRANQAVQEKQLLKEKLEKGVAYRESRSESLEKQMVHDFSKNAFKFFAVPLYQKVRAILEDAKSDGEGIPEMHSVAIDYILKRGKCICGCDLANNEEAIKAIKYERSLLPPENIGTTIRNYKNTCNQFENDADGYSDRIINDYKSIRENEDEISTGKHNLERIQKELIGNIDVSKIALESKENDEHLNDARKRKNDLIEERGAVKNYIEEYEREIDGLASRLEKNKKLQKSIAYANELYKWLKTSYDNEEKRVREDLYTSVNKFFMEMYHGKRKVEIANDYKIILKSEIASGIYVTDTSPGLDTVKNFAFISGLVDLARRKANSEKDEALGNIEPYPIVMDAPFSNADEKHIENISKVLPTVAEQVIMVVMKKDWEYAEKVMKDKTGILYEIDKFSETNSTIRRMD